MKRSDFVTSASCLPDTQEKRNITYGLLTMTIYFSNVGAARKVFPQWLKKTITPHCLSLFPIVLQLRYQTNWMLGLGELLHLF